MSGTAETFALRLKARPLLKIVELSKQRTPSRHHGVVTNEMPSLFQTLLRHCLTVGRSLSLYLFQIPKLESGSQI